MFTRLHTQKNYYTYYVLHVLHLTSQYSLSNKELITQEMVAGFISAQKLGEKPLINCNWLLCAIKVVHNI